jgi:hypothetical protein
MLAIWMVVGVVALTAGGLALRLLARAGGAEPASLSTLALGLCVLGSTVALSLHFAKHQREVRERLVGRIDAIFRALAAQGDDTYVANPHPVYEHPFVGSIHFPGRVRGTRGTLRWELFVQEDEDSIALVVSAGPVTGAKGRLTPKTRDLSPEVRHHVEQLGTICDRMTLEAPGAIFEAGGMPLVSNLALVATRNTKLELVTPETLGVMVQRSLALALALTPSGAWRATLS